MSLPPDFTYLGYNINKERTRQYHELSSDEDMKCALAIMADFNNRAASLQPVMTVKNLVRKLGHFACLFWCLTLCVVTDMIAVEIYL
jgi:hypothetical protein